MAVVDDIDNFRVAWDRFRAMANDRLPDAVDRLYSVKVRLTPPNKNPGPKPV